jgi:hypothetical protein
MLGCDDIAATLSRLVELLEVAETYRKHAFCESA